MKVDRSFTVHTILSTEFITSMKKIILKKEQQAKQFIASQSDVSSAGSVDLRTAHSNEECPTPKTFMAFHPRDHWEFAKDLDHKNAVIFVHGHNYAPNDTSAAEFVLNECLSFYADLPYLVIPFLWPCEGIHQSLSLSVCLSVVWVTPIIFETASMSLVSSCCNLQVVRFVIFKPKVFE